ncbi:hypothetical protein RHSIM_Rhsim10G0162500 [Rhododendron simsii]|uniref:U2A'/phosphoprotein 32 family A C-terminal domain-containing protein n=1 Tax=Rhododendron simsii TaxID=118357 RepID=A0A834GB55_RHOSS|nr:hypothetical protein RHSIM_Rhsim10G0162500 [Rhododendron simsii]
MVVFRAYSRANLPADAIRAFGKMADFVVEFGNDDVDKLLYELCKRKHVRHAQGFFDRVKSEVEPNAKSYSILMRGWGDIGGSVEEAYKLFREMGSKGLEPDAFTYSIFIHAACDANDIHSAFRVLDRMKRYELVPNVYTYNAIIKRLCKNDRVEEAYLLLDEMIERGERPDVWSYNTILAYHCDHNEVNKALRLISRMDQDSCLPDRHTYNMVIKMLIRIGRFDRVTKVWESMEERGFYPSGPTYAVMVHSFCKKKGKLEDACRYFEIMVDEGIPPYSSTCEMLRNQLIGLGFSEQTHILADKMERSTSCSIQELSDIMRDDFRPNGGSYRLLQSCSSLSFNMLKVNALACYIYENETVYSDVIPQWNGLVDLQTECLVLGNATSEFVMADLGMLAMQDEDGSSSKSSNSRHTTSTVPKKYIVCHPSPICYEKHYREYMVASLPTLRVLDNLSIEKTDKERANGIFSQHFESFPYKRKNKASVVSILHKREIRASCTNSQNWRRKPLYVSAKSQCFFSRSLSAAIVGSFAWPLLHPLSISGDESRSFRPLQFEYHPSDSSLMAFGTLDGELIAGSDNGSLKLCDIKPISSRNKGTNSSAHSVTFDEFDQLTSVHVNSTDEWFLASGYSKNVALCEIGCGRHLQVFVDMHQEHINVVKFANHSPSIFATSSFDQDVKMWDLRQKPIFPCYTAASSRGNVMVCFSPDDRYLLVSAVDNEVKQLLAADGRLHLDFNIVSTGSSQNYTRSYYMNGRDYVISGSCDENVVRICCAQTGRRPRDLSLEVNLLVPLELRVTVLLDDE